MANESVDEVGLHENPYQEPKVNFRETEKDLWLKGDFSKAFYHDNGEAVDEFGMKLTVKQREALMGKT